MSLHEIWEALKHWWMHLTGASVGMIAIAVFKDWLLDLGKKLIDWFVSEWERYSDMFWNRRKKKRKVDDKVTIGILQTKVTNLLNWKNSVTKSLRESKARETKCAKNHENCVKSLAEARTQIADYGLRLGALEKKTGIKTA